MRRNNASHRGALGCRVSLITVGQNRNPWRKRQKVRGDETLLKAASNLGLLFRRTTKAPLLLLPRLGAAICQGGTEQRSRSRQPSASLSSRSQCAQRRS